MARTTLPPKARVETETREFRHDTFTVRFTCLCGQEHIADFTDAEHFDCPASGWRLRYYPTVRLLTERPPGPAASQA